MSTRRNFLRKAALAAGAVALPWNLPVPARANAPIDRPHGPRMKLSLAAYSLRSKLATNPTDEELGKAEMTLDGFIDYCASLGLDGTELTGYYFPKSVQETPIYRTDDVPAENPEQRQAQLDTAVEQLNSLKNRAHRLGLDITGTAIGNNFCVPEGPEWVSQINLCKDWIDRSYILGAPVIRIFAGTVPKNDTEENAFKRCVAAIDECLKYAARRGVFLALENHGGITARPAQLLKIVNAVKPSPWFGVNFDSGNFHTDDPYRDLELIAPYAINAQIKVSINREGDRGPADFERIVGILKKANYRGYLTFEYEEKEDPLVAIPKYIEQLRPLIAG